MNIILHANKSKYNILFLYYHGLCVYTQDVYIYNKFHKNTNVYGPTKAWLEDNFTADFWFISSPWQNGLSMLPVSRTFNLTCVLFFLSVFKS